MAHLEQRKQGEILFKQGDDGNHFFVVLVGVVAIVPEPQRAYPGQKINYDRLKPFAVLRRVRLDLRCVKFVAMLVQGDGFGEYALLQGENRTATAYARVGVEDCSRNCSQLCVYRRIGLF